MRKLFRTFFYFSRSERRGIIVLLMLICLVILASEIYSSRQSSRTLTKEEIKVQTEAVEAYRSFTASLQEQEAKEKQQWQKSWHYPSKNTPYRLVDFDPNTADSATFRQLGLPAWMAHNILRYRGKGGIFRYPEDFQKIYGLTNEQYLTLKPYIHIRSVDTARSKTTLFLTQISPDSIRKQTIEKYTLGTKVDLNRADTTQLKKIPGIGSSIARLICGYRQRLGGFYHIKQLRDINLDDSKLAAWFTIDTTAIQRIPINRAGIRRLNIHPYINFYQAKVFVEYRKKYGQVKNLKPFVLYEEFTKEDLERMTHYLSFE